jgi:uncharacterized protein (DUF697 family)
MVRLGSSRLEYGCGRGVAGGIDEAMASDSEGGQRTIYGRFADYWAGLMEAGETADRDLSNRALEGAPIVWMLGKVQSGKSSIVAAITGATAAEVGSGFRPCTRTARVFDFPVEAPAVRFLDTRGLGEVGYDAADDLALAERQSHVVLIVMRATDHQQDAILDAVAAVRRRHPDWPLLVAQTCLHEAYPPDAGHVLPYPFGPDGQSLPERLAEIPDRLTRSLAHQRSLFSRIGGTGPIRFVPIDFTQAGDGYEPRHYGLEPLTEALVEAAPAGIGALIGEMRASARRREARDTNPLILGHAAAAAAVDLVPIAGAIAVPGVQARMLHALAARQGVEWDRRILGEFGAGLGASIVTRFAAQFGIRQLVKLIPVYGQTVGSAAAAATSFATTYALGKAALMFLDQRRRGVSDPAAVATAYRDALTRAFEIARARGIGGSEPTDGAADGKR